MTKNSANVLVVDDIEVNRDALCDIATALGHTSIPAENGLIALEKLKEQAIDLVLLDIMMPEIDGYEVLSHIKDDVTLQDIPVIMITAIDGIDSAVNCIKMGADDYLTKPFKSVLLRAKIGACLERKSWHDKEKNYLRQIEESNQKLEERVHEKTQELTMSNKRLQMLEKAKGDALKLIYYRCQNSLQGLFEKTVSSPLEEATELLDTVKQSFQLTKVDPKTVMYVFELKSIYDILIMAIGSASAFAQSRHIHIGEIPDCGKQVLSQNMSNTMIDFEGIDEFDIDPSISQSMLTLQIVGDDEQSREQKDLFTNALAEIINTAVKFSRTESTVTFSCEPLEKEIMLGIHATGRTIAKDELAQFFEIPLDPQKVTKGRYPGTGPSVVQNIIRLLGGSVRVKNRGTEGISFAVKLRRDKL
ncbi:response regulator [Candidatus Parabeggiatoa sp. HSG14]|uniref:response regulator n=1 Tax=Candidatus Parabeggiatoa sp. HSG14 TaxID=3055593 RepID=UPI0025A7A838|nr:response regulator [Thiotrichales bacterium HSG14]